MKTPDLFAPMADAFTSALGRAATISEPDGANPVAVTAILRAVDEADAFGPEGEGAMNRRATVAFRTADAPDAADGWRITDSADNAVYTMHNLQDDGRGMTRATLRGA